MNSGSENISVLTSSDKAKWDEFYDRLPVNLRDVNFSFDYNFIYEKNGDGKIRLFVYRKNEQIYFYPFLIRTVFSGEEATDYKDIETVYGYTGPVSTGLNPDFISEADKAFCNYCNSEKIITEFIRFNPLLQNQNILKEVPSVNLIALRDYVSVDLTSDVETIVSNYSSQNRNKIRKAEKAGIEIEFDYDCRRFNEFRSIYLENMSRLNAAPMYFFSQGFFEGLNALTKKEGVLVNAIEKGETIGSTVFLKGSSFGHYFLSSATETGRSHAVSNLMLHHGILWAKNAGLSSIHLGGGVTGDESDPLLVFKKNFSKKTVKFYIGKRIHNEKAYSEIVQRWDESHPVEAIKYKFILQRYRFKETDLV
ncbi:MAG: GNAT family N-acetyltransferase [Bacteroidota bacterium]